MAKQVRGQGETERGIETEGRRSERASERWSLSFRSLRTRRTGDMHKQLALFTKASSRTNANHTQLRDTRVSKLEHVCLRECVRALPKQQVLMLRKQNRADVFWKAHTFSESRIQFPPWFSPPVPLMSTSGFGSHHLSAFLWVQNHCHISQ